VPESAITSEKKLQTASKSAYKWQRNACSNKRQPDLEKKQLETEASSHEGQCIPAGCRVTLLCQ